MTPKPFGYFKPDPFGWTDCAETDEGARPLYDQDTVDALIAEHADIATLEQEARQMRARIEMLKRDVEVERCLSFCNRVAELEQQRDDLIMICRPVMEAYAGPTRLDDFERVANAKCSSVEDKGIAGFKPWVATHLKTGNEYRVIGEAIDATNAAENRAVVIYRGNGQTFVRCANEFMDKFSAKETE